MGGVFKRKGKLSIDDPILIAMIIAKPWEGDNDGDGDWSVRNENS